jgi:hypothetical protein
MPIRGPRGGFPCKGPFVGGDGSIEADRPEDATLGQLLEQRRHFNGGLGGVPAAVAGLAAAALDGLVEVVGGDDAVDDRDAAGQADLGQGAGDLGVDEPGVRRGALDDGAQRDQRILFLGLRELLEGEGLFVGAGDPDDSTFFSSAPWRARQSRRP